MEEKQIKQAAEMLNKLVASINKGLKEIDVKATVTVEEVGNKAVYTLDLNLKFEREKTE